MVGTLSRAERLWSGSAWIVRAPIIAIVLMFAIVTPILGLPPGLEWLRWLSYAVNAAAIVAVAREAWLMRKLVGDYQSGMEFASQQSGWHFEAAAAQSVHQKIGNFSTYRALGLSILTSVCCVLLISVLMASLFHGLAARSHVYDPIGLSKQDYLTTLAYILDNATLRGFFAFLDIFEEYGQVRLYWVHALPEKIKLLGSDFAFGISMAALRAYSNIVAIGLIFVIFRIMMLRRKYSALFVEEKRLQLMKKGL